jgi:hypothetical protein
VVEGAAGAPGESGSPAESLLRPDDEVLSVLGRLWDAGHAAYLVGGGIRDALLGLPTSDWDVATDARPERLLELFPEGVYENRFGTVLVGSIEVTTFRRDHRYADHRRPERVTFTDDVFEDLARRDLTINAIAWGRRDQVSPVRLLDPADGLRDLRAGVVRAVGDPAARFEEDALRLLRAVRISAQLGFTIEPHTLAAMSQHAADVAWLSEERVGAEVRRMLATVVPSCAFAVMHETRILEVVLPELLGPGASPAGAADPPLACDRAPTHGPEHAFQVLDAVVAGSPGSARLALAALLHGVRPDDRIRGVAERWRVPGREGSAVLRLVAALRSSYGPMAGDADVRRWMRRSGRDLLHDLARLREAHDAVIGNEDDRVVGADLRGRVQGQVEAGVPLDLADLALDGDDVRRELGILEGPLVGAVLEGLLEAAIEDPGLNDRDRLLDEARRLATELTAGPAVRRPAAWSPGAPPDRSPGAPPEPSAPHGVGSGE